jgi:hypothetical protein
VSYHVDYIVPHFVTFGTLPRKRRTEKDRIYLDILKQRGLSGLSNVELRREAKKYSIFSVLEEETLRKDINRFTDRHDGKDIEKMEDGRIRTKPERGEGNRDLAYDLMQYQLDIREQEKGKRVIRVSWHYEAHNISDLSIEFLRPSIIGTSGISWEDRNPVILVKQGNETRRYDKKNPPRFSNRSSPPNLLYYEVDLPKKKLPPGHEVSMTESYEETGDEDLNIVIADLPPTRRLIFDVVKEKTKEEGLDCMICARQKDRGKPTGPGKGQLVANLLTGQKVYALRLVFENPLVGMDYHFEYQN